MLVEKDQYGDWIVLSKTAKLKNKVYRVSCRVSVVQKVMLDIMI